MVIVSWEFWGVRMTCCYFYVVGKVDFLGVFVDSNEAIGCDKFAQSVQLSRMGLRRGSAA